MRLSVLSSPLAQEYREAATCSSHSENTEQVTSEPERLKKTSAATISTEPCKVSLMPKGWFSTRNSKLSVPEEV